MTPPPGVLTPYPTWKDKTQPAPRRPSLFVRFPWKDATALSEVGSGKFMGCYVVDASGKVVLSGNPAAPTPIDQDLNGNNNPTEDILVSNISTMRLLPVTIEVYWKGSSGQVTGDVKTGYAGMCYLSYKYTFFKKT
jgi:hypothetical protein